MLEFFNTLIIALIISVFLIGITFGAIYLGYEIGIKSNVEQNNIIYDGNNQICVDVKYDWSYYCVNNYLGDIWEWIKELNNEIE